MSFSLFDYEMVKTANHNISVEADAARLKKAVNEACKNTRPFLKKAKSEEELDHRLNLVSSELERVSVLHLNTDNFYPVKIALKEKILSEMDSEGLKGKMHGLYEFEKFCEGNGFDPLDDDALKAFKEQADESVFTAVEQWVDAQKTAHKTAGYFIGSFINTSLKIASQQWLFDNYQRAYVSKTHRDFTCGCGNEIRVPSYSACKCGKIWNAYKITANNTDMFVVREIPVRDVVID